MQRTIKLILTIIVVAICMPLVAASINEIGKYIGLRTVSVPVIGTGSMYPSLFWETGEGGPDNPEDRVVEEYRTNPHMYRLFPGITIFGKTYLQRTPKIGDMVTFASDTTRAILKEEGKSTSAGFIKRIIAVAGDTIELRDGYLLRNGELIEEPYLYRPRSTYGDSTLSDCQQLTVPEGKYFVMGDNRKTSSDSRGELGLIDRQDLTFILPLEEQALYRTLWRDTSQDAELAGLPTLNSQDFYDLLNTARADRGIDPLRPRTALSNSSTLTARAILAGNSEFSLTDALTRAGYKNIISSEFSIRGRYTAQELLDNLLYFADTATQVLDPRYDDIGVVAINQEVNGCPAEVVVGHLGGYIPAEYDQATLDSWISLKKSLESVTPSWERAIGFNEVDQTKLEELLSLLRRRLILAEEIIQAMQNHEWLTENQQARIESDKINAQRVEKLSRELNGE